MKPFNLKECLEGKPVTTRSGRPFQIAAHSPNQKDFNTLCGWVDGYVKSFNSDGVSNQYSELDLFMAPTENKQWVVIAKNKTGALTPYGPYVAKCHAESVAIVEIGTVHEITIIE